MVSEIKKSLDVWRSSWLGYALAGAAIVLRVYWHWRLPPAGYAVTGMAVIAGIMALRQDMGHREKHIWFVVLLLFTSTEIEAISHERQEQTKTFGTIVDGLKTTIQQGTNTTQQLQANLKATNETIGRLVRLEQQQRDIQRQAKLIRQGQTPDLKQHALAVAQEINNFLHQREARFMDETLGGTVAPQKYRTEFDNKTIELFEKNFMTEAVGITHEFEKRKLYWEYRPYHFTCGPPVYVESIFQCGTQLQRTADRIPK